MLKLRVRNNKHQAVWLVEPGVKVGRRASNDLILDEAGVADLQFVIGVKGERLIFHNRAPQTPIRVNGKPTTERRLLKERDVLCLGTVELEVIDPKKDPEAVASPATEWSLKPNSPGISNRLFPLQQTSLVGRSSECDIRLAVTHLSRRHAQLEIVNGLLYIKDLGSANGTFLNGQRVSEARVRRGDELRFDTLSFGVLGPSDDLDKTTIRTPASLARPMARAGSAVSGPRAKVSQAAMGAESARASATSKRGPASASASKPSVTLNEVSHPPVSVSRWAVWLVPAALLSMLLVFLLKR